MTYIPDSLREEVAVRAQSRCEYCQLPQELAYYAHEIDHIYAEKHGGLTNTENLCLSCADCNRHKGSNLCSLDPVTGEIVGLFHPRKQSWADHFHLSQNGVIEPLTPQGRVTAKVLLFNRLDLVVDRERLIRLGKY